MLGKKLGQDSHMFPRCEGLCQGRYRKVEILGNSIQIGIVKRGQFLLPSPFLLSTHKMELLFLALPAAFAVSVNAEAHIPWPSPTCDCDYFYNFPSGGCKVRKILQSISWEGKA